MPQTTQQTLNLIAIDPGQKGAIAILQNGAVRAEPLPIAGKELDANALADTITAAAPTLAAVEKCQAMPKQGVTSMFKFGKGYGALLGILAALDIPTELVTPQTWKRSVLIGTAKDKDAAIAYCRRVFPDVPLVPPRCRKPHDGIADALCLLVYSQRTFSAPPIDPQLVTQQAIALVNEGPIILGLDPTKGVDCQLYRDSIERGKKLRKCSTAENPITCIKALIKHPVLTPDCGGATIDDVMPQVERGERLCRLIEGVPA